ncbi:pyruvate kinase [Heterostelium album PN500]|uniref:Pyruvate kinase n=1 Tax=Heterostelium pallidum (strain ATCC 26659 / Pp 5 / PN500) TaxID=670386 RepID=D3B0M1_HETP5|nr:pyruvate kinase [Heterostelium album PN500]EFA84845.1 pyruvate kinase [Heterostelium album PN500]|eukprot:XP_020436956.1 pyruvate kinase [Heterostelium album PN500]
MSMFKSMYKSNLPPIKDPTLHNQDENGLIDEDQTYSELSWNDYFDSKKDIAIDERGTFRVYECNPGGNGTESCDYLFVFVHGGGYTSMSWALLSKIMKSHAQSSSFRIMAYDSRAHGDTKTSDDTDCSIGTLVADLVALVNAYREQQPQFSKLKVVLVGHSMGGAVVVKASKTGLVKDQVGLVVVDVVEGTAMSALPSMRAILAKRPASFNSVSDAIKWSITSGTLRNLESARVSIPTQIRKDEATAGVESAKYKWITNLAQTEQYWSEWFTGLSKEFLENRYIKLLILAGSDRLDRELMIAQMQGKFQLALLPLCGHVIQEDNPKSTADLLTEFSKRLPSDVKKKLTHLIFNNKLLMATLSRNLRLQLDAPTQGFVRTKIVCTIGPKTMSVEMLVKLIETGMSICRMNFSHGTHEYHGNVIKNLREAVKRTGKGCALMLDTKGPEIRTGKLEGGQPITLPADHEILVDTNTDVPGNTTRISLDYKGLIESVKPGGHILIADVLGETKNVHLPGAVVTLPAVSEKDVNDIKFGIEQEVDFIAASFIRKAEDVLEIRRILGERAANIQIISKIENEEGITNFNDILEASDGIMVARGDLGVEVNMEKIFVAQKMMVSKCNAGSTTNQYQCYYFLFAKTIAGKPVITATQMLESMIKAPRPTRAEATDVANAVLDGTDCVMLSGETASGDYPIEAVDIMSKICREAELVESSTDYHTLFSALKVCSNKPITIAETIASYAVATAIDLKADIIITMTETGLTSRLVSKYKPPMPIFAITSWEYTVKHLLATRGTIPILVESLMGTDKLIQHCLEIAMKQGLAKVGSRVVIVSGIMEGVPGKTNSLRVLTPARNNNSQYSYQAV